MSRDCTCAPFDRTTALKMIEWTRKGIEIEWERRARRYATNCDRALWTRVLRRLGMNAGTFDEFLSEAREMIKRKDIFGVSELWNGSFWISGAEMAVEDIERLVSYGQGPVYIGADTMHRIAEYMDEGRKAIGS